MCELSETDDQMGLELIELIRSRMPFQASVKMDSSLFDDLGFDSLLLLELIIEAEMTFQIRLAEEDLSLESLSTPRNILALIQQKKNDRN